MLVFLWAVLCPLVLIVLAAGTIRVREACGGCSPHPRFSAQHPVGSADLR